MISNTQKLFARQSRLLNTTNLITQSRFYEATAEGRFKLKTTPKALDHKLWKNAVEVSIDIPVRKLHITST